MSRGSLYCAIVDARRDIDEVSKRLRRLEELFEQADLSPEDLGAFQSPIIAKLLAQVKALEEQVEACKQIRAVRQERDE